MVVETAVSKVKGDSLCSDKHPGATQQKFKKDAEFSVLYKILAGQTSLVVLHQLSGFRSKFH